MRIFLQPISARPHMCFSLNMPYLIHLIYFISIGPNRLHESHTWVKLIYHAHLYFLHEAPPSLVLTNTNQNFTIFGDHFKHRIKKNKNRNGILQLIMRRGCVYSLWAETRRQCHLVDLKWKYTCQAAPIFGHCVQAQFHKRLWKCLANWLDVYK